LLHELQGHIILIQDQGINVLDDDGNLALLKEDLQLLPVVLFLLVVLSIVKGMHLNVLREISTEDLCNQKAIIE
jgi:hypothetical protein